MVCSLLTAAIVVPVAAVKNNIVLHSNSHCQADRARHWFYTPYPAGVEENIAEDFRPNQ